MLDLINSKVNHISFGSGSIISSTPTSIRVKFANRAINMNYPLAFDKYLTLENAELSDKVQKDIDTAKSDRAAREVAEKIRLTELMAQLELNRKEKAVSVKKKDLIQAFDDTIDYCEDNDTLRPAYRETTANLVIIPETDLKLTDNSSANRPEVITTNNTVLNCSAKHTDSKTCILNFASAVSPGDIVKEGSYSAEGSLLRSTTLYKSLATRSCWEEFYKPHKEARNTLYDNKIIYTPNVIAFKTDTGIPDLLPEEDWLTVDVITVAPPVVRKITVENTDIEKTDIEAADPKSASTKKLKRKKSDRFVCSGDPEGISKTELENLITDRICRAFEVAHSVGAEVLVISSWGCENNHNPRALVAKCFKTAIDRCGSWFRTIEFALPPVATNNFDYNAFSKVIKTK